MRNSVILSDSEESDIIEILRRSAPQNDTVWSFYETVIFKAIKISPHFKERFIFP